MVCPRSPRRNQVGALAALAYSAFEYFAMLIHLAQFALGIDFVPALYQQVIHNESTACANAETVSRDFRR
jgi:hypothetical protein